MMMRTKPPKKPDAAPSEPKPKKAPTSKPEPEPKKAPTSKPEPEPKKARPSKPEPEPKDAPSAPPTAAADRDRAGSAWVDHKVRYFTRFRFIKRGRKAGMVRIAVPTEIGRTCWETIHPRQVRCWPETLN